MIVKLSTLILGATLALTGCSNHNTTADSQVSDASDDLVDDQVRYQLDWVENRSDKAAIATLAKSGGPELYYNSNRCGSYYSDYLAKLANGDAICVKPVSLPSDVYRKVKQAAKYRFANESDYDQRITQIYSYEHNGDLNRFLTTEDIHTLAAGLNIPMNLMDSEIQFDTYGESDFSYANRLEYTWEGLNPVEYGSQYSHIMEEIEHSEVRRVLLRSEIVLYPGGGFTTEFTLFITDSKLVIVKAEGWNS